MARKEKGIRRLPSGNWYVRVRVNGEVIPQTFPGSTSLETMRQWRDAQKQAPPPPAPVGGSFWDDIEQHLARPTVASKTATIKQRTAHLMLWVEALGRDRPRASIQPREIEAVAARWRRTPTNQPDPTIRGRRGRPSAPHGLAPGTVRKRLLYLQLFFLERNGAAGANPVRGLLKQHREPKAEARAIDYAVIERALAAMPTTRLEGSRRGPAPQRVVVNKAPLRARVMAYTGIPPMILMQIRPEDITWTTPASVRVPPRDKGEGVEARTLPLDGPGLEAFRQFHAAHAYGAFAVGAVNVSFKRALRRTGVTAGNLHLYDLRHSFLTEVYIHTRDEATVGRLGLHAEGSPMPARYTRGAHAVVDRAAVAMVGAALGARQREVALPGPAAAAPVRQPAQKCHAKVSRRRKTSKQKHLRAVS
jgi:integrase